MRATALSRSKTERMLLRPLAAEDRAEYIRVHEVSEDLYRQWLPERPGSSSEQFDVELEKASSAHDARGDLYLVGLLHDGRIAGFFNLTEIVRGVFQNAYAGWRVAADVAEQGLG